MTDEGRVGPDEEPVGSALLYEFDEAWIGVYYVEDDGVRFFSNGETREECIDDMLFTLNTLPACLERIKNGEGEIAEVVPMTRKTEANDHG